MSRPKFLTAHWRHLVLINYQVERDVLRSLVPAGTELDFFQGETFISLVGFRFLHTRIFGVAVPFHTAFTEVNLRFYVRRQSAEGWRRGVVFVRELVPRRAIALIARTLYGEPYLALPMRHRIEQTDQELRVEYGWKRRGQWESISATALGAPQDMVPDSMEEFITEHYWGYTARGQGANEYQVEHPRWRVWPNAKAHFDANVVDLYGQRFAEALSQSPVSSFIAEGSPIAVRYKSAVRCH